MLSLKIAVRYLFSRKSSQAIHWITGISILGIAVGTAALILVLSVFNGFEELLSGMFSKYNPDVKIEIKKGKTFKEDSNKLIQLAQIPGLISYSKTLEEIAMFQYDEAQEFGVLKGVDIHYDAVCSIHDAILEGSFEIEKDQRPLANLGLGIRNKLGVDLDNFQEFIRVFIPDHKETSDLSKSLKRFPFQAQSVYSLQQESDYSTIITSIQAVRQITDNPDQLSSIELKLNPDFKISSILQQIETIFGNDYLVKDRYKQDEAFLKIMHLEKWLFYSLFCLTLLLVSFTIVGTLWMIVLEKRIDISILKSMGMENNALRQVFLNLGILICGIGLILGFSIALIFYWLQKNYGLIGVPDEFIIDSYPIQLRLFDFALVSFTVLCIGLLAAMLPTRKVYEIVPIFREE
ncbi:MAG: ABC transporter permease [Saprospiraceae bacterium]|nr:ABC transporter permease [Saprospiraceae bacterium]HRG68400.1 FtsX-like permease family protein [Saprospiraceae bacterium]